jgi:hypothetical protein
MDKQNDDREQSPRSACPVCGGELIEIRAKLQCSVCHRICETCCEATRHEEQQRDGAHRYRA